MNSRPHRESGAAAGGQTAVIMSSGKAQGASVLAMRKPMPLSPAELL